MISFYYKDKWWALVEYSDRNWMLHYGSHTEYHFKYDNDVRPPDNLIKLAKFWIDNPCGMDFGQFMEKASGSL